MKRMWSLILALLALGTFFYSGYSILNFLMAETPEQALLKGRKMPPEWSAGVWSHGRYIEWYTISDRPVLFALSCFGILVPILIGSILGKKSLRDWKHLIPADVYKQIDSKK